MNRSPFSSNWFRSKWFQPGLVAALIIASFIFAKIGSPWDARLAPALWIDAGAHSTQHGDSFLLSDALMVAAAFIAGWGILRRAISSLRMGQVSIDLLVSIAAIGAIALGNYWEAAAVTFLFNVGNTLEAATLDKTRSALAELVALAPTSATVVDGDSLIEVPIHQVTVGQTVLVRSGAQVPVDGTVTSGKGHVNEASITGESMPASKGPGDQVYAGTVSTSGVIQVVADGVGRDTALARIVARVEEAQDAKAKTQSFIDRFSRWYTPGIIVLAAVVGLITQDPVLALTLLVIGCPGALVISIPVAIVAGVGRGARSGILVKGGEYLETSARINAVAFDKTGTLTIGRPRVTDIIPTSDLSPTKVLELAGIAEVASEHPLAEPVLEAAKTAGVAPLFVPSDVTVIAGAGIVVEADSLGRIGVGNHLLVAEMDANADERAAQVATQLAEDGKTPVLVIHDSTVVGVLGLADQVREEAKKVVAELRRQGVNRLVMLTGDLQPVAEAVARQVGIEDVRAGLLPEEKLHAIQQLQDEGFVVAMVGDGVNDAPALATANVGVAMGAAGSAAALETADIALMGDHLARLPTAIGLARRTVSVMKQNVTIALATVALLLAGVFAGGVTMSLGMLIHEGSVLVVVLNAMRLLRQPRVRRNDSQPDATKQIASDNPVREVVAG